MSSKKSQSVIYREKGNALYKSSCEEGLSPCLTKFRLKDALCYYEKARNSSSKNEEICSASKNIAVASKRLGLYLSQRSESVKERHYYFKEALTNFDSAYRFGTCQSYDWINNIIMSYRETLQEAIDDVNLLEFHQKIVALEDFVKCIVNMNHLRGELLIEIAQLRFNAGVSFMQNGDFKSCLNEMRECYKPIEDARIYGSDATCIATEVRIMEKDIFVHTCIAESTQARLRADDILEKYLMDEEDLNMDMVWKVVDLYKEAIILTRENDMEAEAIALSRLGSLNDKILKEKIKAKACFRRSIQLAMSLHPRTFDSEDWFKECHNVLERYQQEIVQQENEKWNRERASYLEDLKDEIKKVEAAVEKSNEELLKYVYKVHPPKGSNCTLGDVPLKGSDNYRSGMRTLLRNAVIHYHPDKVDVDMHGKKWKVLCEEISKLLTRQYEYFK